MAARKPSYSSSTNLTITSLNALASSSTLVAGWESAAIDNTSDLHWDFRLTAKITVNSTGLSAGTIRLYLVGLLDDSTWPDVFDGTESTETVTDTEIRDAICLLGAATQTDNTASRAYYLDCPSVRAVFRGNLPKKFVIFITHNTGNSLAGSGNQVTITPSGETIA